MPLVRIALAGAAGPDKRRAISEGVHRALVTTFDVAEDDRFHVLSGHEPGTEIIFPASFRSVTFTEGITIIQITCAAGRAAGQKKALYAAIADHLGGAGVRRQDIVVSLVETARENWSFGDAAAPST